MVEKTLSLFYKVLEPQVKLSQARPLLLLLHGIGSNEDDLLGLAPYLDPRLFIISARAPIILAQGSYAWFNITLTHDDFVGNMAEAEQSLITINKFIDEVVDHYGLDSKAVYLMGFSQGAMMALKVALTSPAKLAGIAALSGRLPPDAVDSADQSQSMADMAVFMSHGEDDPVIPVVCGRTSRLFMESLSVDLTYREYPAAHEVSMDNLRDLSQWLTSTLDRKFSISNVLS